jgi:hypothetical protein
MDKGFAPITPRKKKQLKSKSSQPISIQNLEASFSSHFDDVPDPRVNRTKQHLLKDILVIALLSLIAGGEGWEDMKNYGISKQEWLQQFLEPPNGIPSPDTFRRVFEKLDSQILEQKLYT